MSNQPKEIRFTKMHGAGNDYVVLDAIRDPMPDDLVGFARRVAHRNFGIGADQVLVVRNSQNADFRMDIYNADGSQVEMCGNGLRAFYKFLRDEGHTTQDAITVETLAGIQKPSAAGNNLFHVDMGLPVLEPAKIPTTLGSGDGPVLDVEIDVDGIKVTLCSVSMGNPHAVVVVDDVETAPVHTLGSAIELHPAFPNKANVEFIQVIDRTRIKQRTWERGTGETLACGSGACAVGVTSMLRGVVDRKVTIELRGGELTIEWPDNTSSVLMTGPAATVFTGTIPLEGV
jgi:diaminopimelate epimerase